MPWREGKFVRIVEEGDNAGVLGIELFSSGERLILEDGDRIRMYRNNKLDRFTESKLIIPTHPDEPNTSIGRMKSGLTRVSDGITWSWDDWKIVFRATASYLTPGLWTVSLWED